MPLNIVTSRAGGGKSRYCISQIKKTAKEGGRAIYIVPEQFSHEAEAALVSEIGYISDKILATSFKRLSLSVLKNSGKSGIYADNRVKSMIMSKILSELGESLKIFAGASRKTGFVSSMLDVISEFKKAVLTPEDIIACSEKITDNDYFKQKMAELGQIYKKYSDCFTGSLADSQDTITAASAFIGESGMFSDCHVFIDEFFRFTKQEIMFIDALLKEKCDVTVTLSMDTKNDSGGIFDPAAATAKRLCELCKNAGDSFSGIISLDNSRRFVTEELSHLEREFTSYPPEKYEKQTENIFLYTAPDIYAEVTHLAAQISKMVKREGFSYSDISIIAGNFERYADVLGTVFADYDIPVFTDNKKSVLTHPIMLALFSVFDVIIDGFNTKDVLAYIKTGLSPISAAEADVLENHVVKSGIKNGDWLDDARFVLRAKSVFDSENELTVSEQAELLQIKNKVISPILRLKEKLAKSRKVAVRIQAISDFFEETELFEKTVLMKDLLEEMGDRKRAAEYASVYSILTETLAHAAEFMGDSSMGMERLKAMLSAGFGDLSVGVVPTEYEQVFFGDENRSVVKNVRALFIIGANSGAFPQEISAGGIFSDAERLFLEKQGFEIAPDTEKRIFDSRFLVYNTLAIPKERLYLSYALSDIDGKGLRPSQVLASIGRIFPNLSSESGEPDGGISPSLVVGNKSAYNYVLSKMASKCDNPLAEALKDILIKDENFKEKLEIIEKRVSADMRAERLTADSVSGLYGKKLTGSVSRFEKFSECPFSYFVQYGLKAKERKAPGPEATDTGSLLHSVIEIFSKRIHTSGKRFAEISENECKDMISDIIDELVLDSFIKNLYSEKKLATFVRRLKSLAQRSALAICEHVRRGEFSPCAFEFSFDENGDTPPIRLTLPNGAELSIIGKIDRVDSFSLNDKVYIKIIDYKSGAKKFSLSDIFNGLSLQLTVYLTAYVSADDSREPAGMFYFRLSDPVTEAGTLTDNANIAEEIIKKYKMSGLVLSDEDIIEAMERGKDGYFSTIPVMRKKDGTISEGRSSCASGDDFETLKNYVNQTLCDLGNEIFSGNVSISPVKNGKKTACDYCDYGSVCGIGKYVDADFKETVSLDNAEIFSEMRKKV